MLMLKIRLWKGWILSIPILWEIWIKSMVKVIRRVIIRRKKAIQMIIKGERAVRCLQNTTIRRGKGDIRKSKRRKRNSREIQHQLPINHSIQKMRVNNSQTTFLISIHQLSRAKWREMLAVKVDLYWGLIFQ